jgi:hypothetical protein
MRCQGNFTISALFCGQSFLEIENTYPMKTHELRRFLWEKKSLIFSSPTGPWRKCLPSTTSTYPRSPQYKEIVDMLRSRHGTVACEAFQNVSSGSYTPLFTHICCVVPVWCEQVLLFYAPQMHGLAQRIAALSNCVQLCNIRYHSVSELQLEERNEED